MLATHLSATGKVRIVILNYNGETLLPLCLPSIVEAAQESRWPVSVTLLDNLSTDHGLSHAKRAFPAVEAVSAPANRFLCSYNDYLEKVRDPIVILLNNDIRVDKHFVDPLVQKFDQDKETFLVAPRVMNFEGDRVEAGRSIGKLRLGIYWCSARYPGYEKETLAPSETCTSGFGAFSRNLFCRLGGYDPLYLPGIFEDVDLCYRAKQQGYRLYYEPQSVVYHIGQASFKKAFGSEGIACLAHRNNFLFMWKNFSGLKFWITHLFFLPFRLLFAVFTGNRSFVAGLWQALKFRVRPSLKPQRASQPQEKVSA